MKRIGLEATGGARLTALTVAVSILASAGPLAGCLINSPMLPQMKKGKDGSLTIYVQKDSPGKANESNWLPAPDGSIYMVRRLYWPKSEALEGTWRPRRR